MTETSMEDILSSIKKILVDDLQDDKTVDNHNQIDVMKQDKNNLESSDFNSDRDDIVFDNKIFKLSKSQIIDLDDDEVFSDSSYNVINDDVCSYIKSDTISEVKSDKRDVEIVSDNNMGLENLLVNEFFNRNRENTKYNENIKNIINIDSVANNFISSKSVTLEDVVKDAVRPVIADWLNHNLYNVVEDVVKKEMQKIIAKK